MAVGAIGAREDLLTGRRVAFGTAACLSGRFCGCLFGGGLFGRRSTGRRGGRLAAAFFVVPSAAAREREHPQREHDKCQECGPGYARHRHRHPLLRRANRNGSDSGYVQAVRTARRCPPPPTMKRSGLPDSIASALMLAYLARHGESDWNAANRFQGTVDRPLTERGRSQAERLAEGLARAAPWMPCTPVPLRRALDTAAIWPPASGSSRSPTGAPRDRRRRLGGSLPSGGRGALSEGSRAGSAAERAGTDGENYEQMSRRVLAAVGRIAGAHPAAACSSFPTAARSARFTPPPPDGRARVPANPPRRAQRAPVHRRRRGRANHADRLNLGGRLHE